MARINLWQVMPKSKQFAKDWRVHIHGDADLAASFRKRIKFVECSISDPNQWMFCGTFCNKKTALNSINRTLHRYSYPKLQFDAIESEFVERDGEIIVKDLAVDVGSGDNAQIQDDIEDTKFIAFKDQLNKEHDNWEEYGSNIINRL